MRSTAMESATAVKAAATTAAETTAAAESASAVPTKAAPVTAKAPAVAAEAAPAEPARTASEPKSPIAESRASIKPASVVAAISVIPRPSPDKHTAHKVVRPVEAVRRARIRSIPVVTVRANRPSCISRTDSNTHRNLGPRISRGKKKNPQQCCVLEISHHLSPFPA